jgi:hypothetical protein
MSLLELAPRGSETRVDSHRPGSTMDERYAITQQEFDTITSNFFPESPARSIQDFPSKEKCKLVILMQLAKRFEPGRRCTEWAINLVLEATWHDFVTLRRHRIEYGSWTGTGASIGSSRRPAYQSAPMREQAVSKAATASPAWASAPAPSPTPPMK